ncbi:predicted protein [Arabidopsis lyrata subsp. lyrata]|uniref:Predicted protein n=1 Tax=Arabidopsis lyrata subsp. lyrata TaxID=81972 RepID=D7LET2_ARALL|nr:predicted protein [Arabidopsis lyrata subsp. lyrata]
MLFRSIPPFISALSWTICLTSATDVPNDAVASLTALYVESTSSALCIEGVPSARLMIGAAVAVFFSSLGSVSAPQPNVTNKFRGLVAALSFKNLCKPLSLFMETGGVFTRSKH